MIVGESGTKTIAVFASYELVKMHVLQGGVLATFGTGRS